MPKRQVRKPAFFREKYEPHLRRISSLCLEAFWLYNQDICLVYRCLETSLRARLTSSGRVLTPLSEMPSSVSPHYVLEQPAFYQAGVFRPMKHHRKHFIGKLWRSAAAQSRSVQSWGKLLITFTPRTKEFTIRFSRLSSKPRLWTESGVGCSTTCQQY
jgi:hypothetical protein